MLLGLLPQLLENHIKNELIENSQLVHALPNSGDNRLPPSEPRKSASIACGASVFEVSMKVSTWASQVRFFLTSLSLYVRASISICLAPFQVVCW